MSVSRNVFYDNIKLGLQDVCWQFEQAVKNELGSPQLKECPHKFEYFDSKGISFFHHARYQESGRTIVFTCMPNFMLTEGDAIHTCGSDGKWIGKEPICTAIPYRDKLTISLSVITACLVVGICVLLTDFMLWKRRKWSMRVDARRWFMNSDLERSQVDLIKFRRSHSVRLSYWHGSNDSYRIPRGSDDVTVKSVSTPSDIATRKRPKVLHAGTSSDRNKTEREENQFKGMSLFNMRTPSRPSVRQEFV